MLFVNNLIVLKKILEKPTSSIKIEKALIDLPNRRQNLSLKITQAKPIERVEKCLLIHKKKKKKKYHLP